MADWGGQSKVEPCGGTCPACREFQRSEQDSRDRLIRTMALKCFGAALWNLCAPLTGEDEVQPFEFYEWHVWRTPADLLAEVRGEVVRENWPLFGVKQPEQRWQVPYGMTWPKCVRWKKVGTGIQVISAGRASWLDGSPGTGQVSRG